MLKNKAGLIGLFAMLGIVALPNGAAADAATEKDIQGTTNVYDVKAQSIESQAVSLVVKANQLLNKGQYDQARELYMQAQKEFERFNSPTFREKIAFCQKMIKRTYLDKAHAAMKQADKRAQVRDFEEAIALCEEAMKYCPEERVALQKRIDFYRRRQSAAVLREETSPERLMPNLKNQDYQVEVLLYQGRELHLKGEYMKAQRAFQEVLLIDPFNADALQNLGAINRKIDRIGNKRFVNTMRKMVTEIEWKYTVPITPEAGTSSTESILFDGTPVERIEREESALQKKLNSIIIPRIDFEDVTITAAVRNLRDQSRQQDPERLGVNIFLRRSDNSALAAMAAEGMMEEGGNLPPGLRPPTAPQPVAAPVNPDDPNAVLPEGEEQRINLYMTNRSLMEVITNFCKAAKLRYRVDTFAVVLAPQDVALDDMETRIFPVEQSALASIDGGGEDREGLRRFFIEKGIDFPFGSKIVYDTRISRLIVTNTVEHLRMIDEIIQEVLDQQEPMVQVMAKFIEISQTDLKELAFNYQVEINNRTGVDRSGSNVVMGRNSNELMRYYRPDTGGDATDRNPVSESTFSYVWENSDGTKVSASMFALNYADSADVLASPRVTTLPGQTAHIEMVTERFFPDEWETIDLPENNEGSGNDSNQTSSSWRGTRADPQPVFEAEPRQLGIMFDITPEVDRDRRTITAQIVFPIQTFSGWMKFDARSSGTSDDDGEYFQMPIFDRRVINTMITVYDGDTVVLGGVASDKTETILDKIPILGDLPFIGRFFQSRYTNAEKRNLLVFLTCKLVKPDGTAFFPAEERTYGVPDFGRNYH